MLGVCNAVSSTVLGVLTTTGAGGLKLNEIAAQSGATATIAPHSISVMNSAPELVERTARAKYPSVSIYCDKLTNSLKEKFRTMSGTVHVVVEVRYSQDRLELMEKGLQALADAVCTLLDGARGDWGSGLFYGGRYEATFGAVKAGGLGFLQIGKVGFEVEVSR